jgi:hypothetical protein
MINLLSEAAQTEADEASVERYSPVSLKPPNLPAASRRVYLFG